MWTVDKLRGLADTMDQYDGDVPESMGTGLPQAALRWSADQLARLHGGLMDTNHDLLALIDQYEAEREQFRQGVEYAQADTKKALARADKAEDEVRRLYDVLEKIAAGHTGVQHPTDYALTALRNLVPSGNEEKDHVE